MLLYYLCKQNLLNLHCFPTININIMYWHNILINNWIILCMFRIFFSHTQRLLLWLWQPNKTKQCNTISGMLLPPVFDSSSALSFDRTHALTLNSLGRQQLNTSLHQLSWSWCFILVTKLTVRSWCQEVGFLYAEHDYQIFINNVHH